MGDLVGNFKKIFEKWAGRLTFALMIVLVVLFIMISVGDDYPCIHPYLYYTRGNHTGLLLFVLWGAAYAVLELILFIGALAEGEPPSPTMMYFIRGFMAVHFLVASVLQFIDLGNFADQYELAYGYLACYVLSAVLCIVIIILMATDK